MKNIIYSLIRISLLIGLSGCEKDVETWHGEDGVYFYVQWGVDWYDTTYWAAQPYTKIEFVKQGTSETTVKMRVMATGPHKNMTVTSGSLSTRTVLLLSKTKTTFP